MAIKDILLPDLGGAESIDVIEILVKPGDQVKEEDPLLSLESDKATMDVPSPFSGTIKELKVKVGDSVEENSLVMTIDTAEEEGASQTEIVSTTVETPVSTEPEKKQLLEVIVPDLGGAEGVEVIEVLVKPGDSINEDDSLVSLESDKATMEVPSPYAGVVQSIKVNVGDKISEGTLVVVLESSASIKAETPQQSKESVEQAPSSQASVEAAVKPSDAVIQLTKEAEQSAIDSSLHASPVVRRVASEFGVNLSKVNATGPKGRITKEDVQNFVKNSLAGSPSTGGSFALPQAPVVDFSKFGDIETTALNKIKRLTGKNLSRNWLMVPHVTQFDDADITEMEAFRKENKAVAEKQGFKLTPLVFIMKALVSAMKQHPTFNASLTPDAQALILKKYFHVGVAVDTPNGLVVPVVRDVNLKGVFDLAKELGEISIKARDGKLLPKDMQGGCMTISSLGGIGGSAFTPIVNVPEVAILGVSRAQNKPVYQEGQFVPRLMLPLSLSYDHRVIDGAEGARFITYLSKALADLRQLIL